MGGRRAIAAVLVCAITSALLPEPPASAQRASGTAHVEDAEQPPDDGDAEVIEYGPTRHPRWGLVIAGTIVFALSWGAGIAFALRDGGDDGSGWLAVPWAGPFLWFTDAPEDAMPLVPIFLAIAEITGTVLALVGLVARRADPGPAPTARRRRERPSISVSPFVTPDVWGIGLSAT